MSLRTYGRCEYKEVFIMRKPLIFILSILLIGILAAPAAAVSPGFILKLNGEYCQESLQVHNGVSSIPLKFVEKVVPVKTAIENEKIVMSMNDDILELRLNSNEAIFNGKQQTMPVATQMDNQEIMIPLRFVLESFGATVGWDGSKNEIAVTSPVLKAGLTAEQMLGKITQAMSEQGRYKMNADTIMKMQMTSDGKTENMTMSGQVNGSVQENPLLAHVVTKMKMEEISGIDEAIPEEALKSEMVINDNGLFMTLPGHEGWVKMDLQGMDFGKLMEQYGSQDPVKQIMQMKEFGAAITYGDDQVKDDKNYGVIHVAMGEEALGQYIDSFIKQTGLLNLGNEQADKAEFEATMKDIFNNMKTEMDYNMVFDYDSFLTLSMDLNMVMNMNIDVPANAETGTPASSVQIKSKQEAVYQIYDYGVEFTVPDVSGAKTMAEAMESMINK